MTTTTTQNVYSYQSTNLIISYSIAIAVSTAAVLLGAHAIYQNGASYDATVSAIATTMQNPEVSVHVLKCSSSYLELIHARQVQYRLAQHPGGAQPIDRGLANLRLRFRPGEGFAVDDISK